MTFQAENVMFKQFKQSYATPEPDFYIHCVNDCDAYKSLNLIVNCGNCHRMFINPLSKGRHTCRLAIRK